MDDNQYLEHWLKLNSAVSNKEKKTLSNIYDYIIILKSMLGWDLTRQMCTWFRDV